MSVHHYEKEGPLIIGEEACNLDSYLHQMSLEGSSTTWLTPEQRSPISSRYPMRSPNFSETLAPSFYSNERQGTAPHYIMQGAENGSLLSPHIRQYPAFNLPTPPWGVFHSTHYGPGAIGQERHSPFTPPNPVHRLPRNFLMSRGRHVREQSGGYHNVVDVNRIRQGADVRTTVCCLLRIQRTSDLTVIRLCYETFRTRSIRYVTLSRGCGRAGLTPQAMLKAIVDESSRGRYDFMYLRIGKCSAFSCRAMMLTEPIRFCE